jgi:hypothetical protein
LLTFRGPFKKRDWPTTTTRPPTVRPVEMYELVEAAERSGIGVDELRWLA